MPALNFLHRESWANSQCVNEKHLQQVNVGFQFKNIEIII
jgi:hypothetical protein